jgi:hypothetical protein
VKVRLLKVDGTEFALLDVRAPVDVIVWGKEKPRYFVRVGAETFREAVVAFVNPAGGKEGSSV